MKNIEEFCLVCYTAFFFKNCVQHLVQAISKIRLCRCCSWGNSGCIGIVFGSVQLSCRSNQGWSASGWKKVCYRRWLRALVPGTGIRGAGSGVSITEVVGTVGGLFAGELEG